MSGIPAVLGESNLACHRYLVRHDKAVESVATLLRTGLPVCRFAAANRHPREPAAHRGLHAEDNEMKM
jgi:hypothetical protein